jgi:hypothetical protein
MFAFFKFLKVAVLIISVALAIALEVKKIVQQHYEGVQEA